MKLEFDSDFHGGNGSLIKPPSAKIIEIGVRTDRGTAYWQWFCFRLKHYQKSQPPVIKILASRRSLSLRAWEVARVVASTDGKSWRRIAVDICDDSIHFNALPSSHMVCYALFPPYSAQRQREFEAHAESAGAKVLKLGSTAMDNSINALVIGEPAGSRRSLWVIARQHSGETMAQWWAEGFVDHLLKTTSQTALRTERTAVYVVPNMNPDGSALGHIRTNGAGVDLNRAWQSPAAESAPEVTSVLAHMANTGVDLFLDVHGDELASAVYMLSNGGIENFAASQTRLVKHYCTTLLGKTLDFQMKFGGRSVPVGAADLRIGINQVGHRFGCVGMTLEMPFRDHFDNADDERGWTTDRSCALGTACASALVDILSEI